MHQTSEEVESECASMRWGTFKPILAEALINHLKPIQDKYEEIMDDRAVLDGILRDGAFKANTVAQRTVDDVRDAMGFLKAT